MSIDEEDGSIEVIPRDPRNGIWGTSKYIELFSPIQEISRRYSENSRVLDLYTKPIPVFKESNLDSDRRWGVDPDDTAMQRQEKILEGQSGMIAEETMHLPDDLLDVSYLQPAAEGVQYSLEQINSLSEMIRDLAGLPNLQGQTLSGEALKRIYIHFYAETKATQNAVRLAMERLTGQTVEWPHLFDTSAFGDTAGAEGDATETATPTSQPDGKNPDGTTADRTPPEGVM